MKADQNINKECGKRYPRFANFGNTFLLTFPNQKFICNKRMK